MNHYLTEGNWLRAVRMWAGGADTFAIAAHFECHEAFIYAELPAKRQKYPKISEAYAA